MQSHVDQGGGERSPFSILADLHSKVQYQRRYEHIFPSLDALEWFIRKHRQRLLSAQAVLIIRNSQYIDPGRFDAEVLAISGEREAV